jgi:hypothetical protein
MREDELRSRVLDSLKEVSVPEARIEDVVRRVAGGKASRDRWTRRLGWAAAAALLLAAIVLPLTTLLPLGGSRKDEGRTRDPAASPAQTLSVGGIQVSLPDEWEGHVYYIRGYTRPVIRMATFSLPDVDDIEASKARSAMNTDDVLIGLTEYSAVCPCPGFDQIELPISIEAEAFQAPFDVWHDLPPQTGAVPTTHDFARLTFAVDHRFFDVWVEFGRTPAPQEAISTVDAMLESLTIGEFKPPLQPDGLCNEWSLQKDPDCPQTIWLNSVLSAAGFAVIDSPEESTLVGRGDGAKFFIWTREPTKSLEESGLRFHSTIDGVDVYGGSQLVWRAQGLNIWIGPGPEGGDDIPNDAGLASLVRATLQTPYLPEADQAGTRFDED